ncbi:MAG: bifunctional adenosylcobinamide kinase/adenosylcobinamide-phosphate guanylyltransferase [Oscillatoriales cyanobacterium C42_A2020_001]|nr:bifunctional adenosylcobinamide kinase/adenosylcobinamide-phosphate guanylyltransferase [Leptolyngbyaceae cyanobacterium C42_A2020_001]
MGILMLVTGPARSGKSEWAEQLATQTGQPVTYVATAQVDPTDAEWQARIQRHQQRRSPEWITQHVPLELATAIQHAPESACLLIDSLGTWLANCLEQDEAQWEETAQRLLQALIHSSSTLIVVAEETGWGVVPAYPIGRTFRDRLGALTCQIGIVANPVYLVTAGYALNLTQLGTPLSPRT